MSRPCRKDDLTWPWPCSCDDCSREAAAAWRANIDRVLDGEIALEQAQREWYESEFLLADLGPMLDESRRRREERSR